MNGLRTTLPACALIGALALAPSAYGQGSTNRSGAQPAVDPSRAEATESAAEKEALAESIVARQEAPGRTLERAFRARVTGDLASRPLEELLAIQKEAGLTPNPQVLGANSAADLVYTPVAPCRIIDTRVAGGPIAAGTQRNFYAAISNYSSQGGSATTCGIPFGPTTAVVVNVVAVNPAGAGNLRAFAFGGTLPTASIVNYAKVNDVTSGGPLNIANAFLLKICDVSVSGSGCLPSDFTIQADVSSTQVVMDVLGFYRRVDSTMNQYAFTSTGVVAGDNFYYPPTIHTAPQAQRCIVVQNTGMDLAAAFSTGFSYSVVAVRNETAGTDTAFGFGDYFPYNPIHIGSSNSGVVALTANTDYKFGCYVQASGNLPNAGHVVGCNVSVHCQ